MTQKDRQNEYLAQMQKLYANSYFADIVIKCQDQEFKAHRSVLAAHSGYFMSMLHSGLVESNSGVVDLSEHEPQVVKAMLQFAYTTQYTLSRTSESEQRPILHAKIYGAGEYFQLPGLKSLAKMQFRACLEISPATCFNAAHAVYTTTPSTDRGLRQPFCDSIRANIDEVFHEGKMQDERRETLKPLPELMVDLLLLKAVERPSEHTDGTEMLAQRMKCTPCNQVAHMLTASGEVYRCPECWTILKETWGVKASPAAKSGSVSR